MGGISGALHSCAPPSPSPSLQPGLHPAAVPTPDPTCSPSTGSPAPSTTNHQPANCDPALREPVLQGGEEEECQANRTKAWRSGKGCHPEGVLLQKREEDEWKIKTKQQQSLPKADGVKMREQFILKPDVKNEVEESKAQSGDNSVEVNKVGRPKVEADQPEKHREPRDNCEPTVRPEAKPSVNLSANKLTCSRRAVKQNDARHPELDSEGSDIITSLKRQVEEDDSDNDLFVPVKETNESEEAASEKLLTSE